MEEEIIYFETILSEMIKKRKKEITNQTDWHLYIAHIFRINLIKEFNKGNISKYTLDYLKKYHNELEIIEKMEQLLIQINT